MKTKCPRPSRRPACRKGAILSLLVLLMLLMSMLSAALIHLAQQARLRSVRHTAVTAARMAADAGAERAIYLINRQIQAGGWNGTVPLFDSEALPAGNASYTVTLEGDETSGYELISTGISGHQRRSVRVRVDMSGSSGGVRYAIMTQGSIVMKNQGAIRGYNSEDPSDSVPAAIATLSTLSDSIYTQNNSYIYGDVYVGPGGDPDRVVRDPGAVVGDMYTLPDGTTMPVVEAPDYVASKGSLEGRSIVLNSSSSGKYTNINISNNGSMQINGDVVLYITGDVKLNNNSEILINDGSSLKLYVNGNMYFDNHTDIRTVSRFPGDSQIFGTDNCRTIHFQNNSTVYSVICAPQASLYMNNGGSMYGAFITKSFEMKNGGTIYYDEALLKTSVDHVSGSASFSVVRWEDF